MVLVKKVMVKPKSKIPKRDVFLKRLLKNRSPKFHMERWEPVLELLFNGELKEQIIVRMRFKETKTIRLSE